MLDLWLAGRWISHSLAGHGIDHRALDILEVNIARLEPIARLAHAAGGDKCIFGEETVAAGLLDHLGFQPQHALVISSTGVSISAFSIVPVSLGTL